MDASAKTLTALNNRLKILQLRVGNLFPLMRGSVVRIGTKGKHPTYSLNLKGKTRIVYLGKAKEPIVKAWVENYRKLQQIIDEMTFINIEIVRRMDIPVKSGKK